MLIERRVVCGENIFKLNVSAISNSQKLETAPPNDIISEINNLPIFIAEAQNTRFTSSNYTSSICTPEASARAMTSIRHAMRVQCKILIFFIFISELSCRIGMARQVNVLTSAHDRSQKRRSCDGRSRGH